MKKVFFALMLGLALVACTKEYDDSALKEQIENLEGRVDQIAEDLATYKSSVDALKSLAQAIKEGKYIVSYAPFTGEEGTGYTITFSDETSIVVYHGEKGDKGEPGDKGNKGDKGDKGEDGVNAPSITVAENNGELYWFIGSTPAAPVYEASPVFFSEEGKLYVKFGEQEPVEVGTLTGKSIFEDVEVVDGEMVFTFLPAEGETVGESFRVPLAEVFALEVNTEVGLAAGAVAVDLPYVVKGGNDATVVDVIAFGCKAVVEADVIKITEITEGASVLAFADNQEGKTSIRKITFAPEKVEVTPVAEALESKGGNVSVKGITNVEFDVVISEEAKEWLSYVEKKAAFELLFSIKPNAGAAREAEVSLVRKGTETVLTSFVIAQQSKPLEPKRVWGKYAPDSNGWIVMGAGNLDRGMAMDNQYIYVSKSTAYAPVIKAFKYDGTEAFECNVTGMGSDNEWGDAMQYSVNCVRTMPKADGSYVLIACNLKLNDTQVLEVWAWVDGPESAPTCIGRYAYDSVANAQDHRRYGDRFDVKGTWEEGELWFPSMQADDHGKTIVFKTFAGVDAANRPSAYYRMEPSQSNMKDLAFYPGADEVFSTCPANAKFVKLDGTTHSTGWINWAVTADYTETHLLTFGYNFFEVNGKKYIAYVKIDQQNGKTGRLVIIEDGDGSLDGFKAALTANKVAWEFPLQHESDFAAESAASTGNTLGNCKVVTVDGVKYIGAHIQGLGCSLFRFE